MLGIKSIRYAERGILIQYFIKICTSLRVILNTHHPEHGLGIDEPAFLKPCGINGCRQMYPYGTGTEYIVLYFNGDAGFYGSDLRFPGGGFSFFRRRLSPGGTFLGPFRRRFLLRDRRDRRRRARRSLRGDRQRDDGDL